MGLIKAIQTFKPEKKSKLASYASRCIENEILMHLRAVKKTQNEISLYEPVGTDRDGNEIVMLDIINTNAPDFAAALDFTIESQKLITAIEKVLTPRERFVVCLRYGLGKYDALTQQEIARKLGISRSYVSRIEKKALQKLCRALELSLIHILTVQPNQLAKIFKALGDENRLRILETVSYTHIDVYKSQFLLRKPC